jgi:hypothetical protein
MFVFMALLFIVNNKELTTFGIYFPEFIKQGIKIGIEFLNRLPIDTIATSRSIGLTLDQAGLPQFLQVLAYCTLSKGQHLHDLTADTFIFFCEHAQYRDSGGMAERLCKCSKGLLPGAKLLFLVKGHFLNLISQIYDKYR